MAERIHRSWRLYRNGYGPLRVAQELATGRSTRGPRGHHEDEPFPMAPIRWRDVATAAGIVAAGALLTGWVMYRWLNS